MTYTDEHTGEQFHCQSCGACCSYKWSWPILRRDRSDADRIPPEMQRRDYPLMQTLDNRCIALEGPVGSCVRCSIYEDRPRACRDFQPGSALCREARRALNIIPTYKRKEQRYEPTMESRSL